jgi:hypothetical protein
MVECPKRETPKSETPKQVSRGLTFITTMRLQNVWENGKRSIDGRNQSTLDLVRALRLKSRKIYLLKIDS